MTTHTHCKIAYQVVVPYSDESYVEIIIVNGQEFKIERLPRPCTTEKDLMAVFHNGVRFPSFAKFLKTIAN